MVRVLNVNPFCRKACLKHPKLWSFSSIFLWTNPRSQAIPRYRTYLSRTDLFYIWFDMKDMKLEKWHSPGHMFTTGFMFMHILQKSVIIFLHENEISCIFSWIRVLAFHVSWKRKRQLFDDDLTVNSRHKKTLLRTFTVWNKARKNPKMLAIASGKHTKSYWNWPFIDGLPIKNGGSFHSYGTVYQSTWLSSRAIGVAA